MNKLFKLLFICITIICLSACQSNKTVSDSDLEGTLLDEDSQFHGFLNATSAYTADTNNSAIKDLSTFVEGIINTEGIKLDTAVVVCYEIEDDSVKDDEIIVDFYDGGTVNYYYVDEYKEIGNEAMHSIKCPATSVVLDKEGSYYVKGQTISNQNFNNITLKFGKHYVFQFGSVKKLIENYYNY